MQELIAAVLIIYIIYIILVAVNNDESINYFSNNIQINSNKSIIFAFDKGTFVLLMFKIYYYGRVKY